MDIIYRPAVFDDIDEISALVSSAVSEMERNGIHQWDDIYPTEEDFSEDISKGELFAGTLDGRIAVIFTVNQSCDEEYNKAKWHYPNEPFGVIHRLCVCPEFQRRGIAADAVLYAEKLFREHGITAVRLDVFSENPYALRLYEKLGFHKTGTADWRMGRFFLMEKYIGS